MKKIIIVILVLLVIVGVTLSRKDSSNEQVTLQVSWIPTASFVGDVAAAVKFDTEHNLDLKVEFGGTGINPVQMVESGRAIFGSLGADEVLAANDKGADMVIIGVINYNSPAAYVSLVEKNIKTPQDLVGKKVGVLPYGNTTMIYETMLKKNGINRNSISEITTSFDLKPFLSGSYDVHPVYVYDETVTLDEAGIAYNVLEPKDYGVVMKGQVYFTKRSTLENNPELVKNFVRAVADGWNYSIENQASAIEMLKAYAPEIDANREAKVLAKQVPYVTGYKNQPLNSDTESWDQMIGELMGQKVIKNPVDVGKVLRLEFIINYYE